MTSRRRIVRIEDDCNVPQPRRNLFEQAKPFRHHRRDVDAEPGNIAARAREALHKALSNGIGGENKDNWNGAGHWLQHRYSWSCARQDRIRTQANQFVRISFVECRIASSKAVVDSNIPALDPTQLLQALPESVRRGLAVRICLGEADQGSNAPHPLRLLSVRRERPRRRRASEQGYQLAPSYVGHGLPLGTRCASLPHAKVARKVPAGPWGRPELF